MEDKLYQDDGDCANEGRHNLDSLRELRRSSSQSMSSYTRKIAEINNLEFLVPLADEFKCPVCLSLMSEPKVTSCGHHFCRVCIDPVKQGPCPECPICNEPEFNMITAKKLEKRIKALQIYCVYREKGCAWTGELVSLDDHLEQDCSIVSEVSGKFESLSCKEKVPERDIDNDKLLSHVTMFVEQFEAQQKAFQHLFEENDTKIVQLERRVDQVENDLMRGLNNKSYIKWSPINSHRLACLKGQGGGVLPGVHTYRIPDHLVPKEAKEILLLVDMRSGNTYQVPMSTQCMSIFVKGEAGMQYGKYLHYTTYKQDAWNCNTENMCLPMPSDRTVCVNVPKTFENNLFCEVFLTGYR
jgi:hypothetical protein